MHRVRPLHVSSAHTFSSPLCCNFWANSISEPIKVEDPPLQNEIDPLMAAPYNPQVPTLFDFSRDFVLTTSTPPIHYREPIDQLDHPIGLSFALENDCALEWFRHQRHSILERHLSA